MIAVGQVLRKILLLCTYSMFQNITLPKIPTTTQLIKEETQQTDPPSTTLPPINGGSLLSNLHFHSTFHLLRTSQNKTLAPEQLPPLTLDQHTLAKLQAFTQNWENSPKEDGTNLLKLIISTERGEICKLVFISFIVYAFYLCFPILIYFDISYVNSKDEDIGLGVALFLLTTVGLLMFNICENYLRYSTSSFGINLTSTINLAIFQKALKFPLLASHRFSEADIINLSQIDAENLNQVASKAIYLLFGIVQVVVELLILYFFIGWLFLIPLVTMALITAINFCIGRATIDLSQTVLEKKDDRLSAIEEMLSIIKHIKTNTLEKYFFKRIKQEREGELQALWKKGFLQSILVFLCNLTVPLMLSAIFVTMHIVGIEVTAPKVFVTMAVSRIFQFSSEKLPSSITEIVNIYNSIRRIQEFLLTEEIDANNYQIRDREEDGDSIVIKDGDFYASSNVDSNGLRGEKTTKESSVPPHSVLLLSSTNLTIQKGLLYMVFGDIGAGKSSLLFAILNELRKRENSHVTVNGRVAYVSQRPWVMCDSLQDNIKFASEANERLLQRVLTDACLNDDVKMLPEGRRTILGEEGINLSGGQKTRVSLGRALFSQSDIYLLDDILSAVDVHVGQHILREAIGKSLKGKTVIMVTHATKFAGFADRIILMKEGRMIAEGDYQAISKMPQFTRIEAKIDEQEDGKKTNKQAYKIQMSNLNPNKAAKSDSNIESTQQLKNIIVLQESQIGQLKLQIVKKYIDLNGGYIWFFLIIVGSFVAYGSLQAATMVFVERWSGSYGEKAKQLYLYVGLGLASVIFLFIQTYSLVRSSIQQGENVHSNIVKNILYSSYTNFFNRVPKGRILNRLSRDIKQLDEVVALSLSNTLLRFVQFLTGLVLMVYSSTPFVLIPAAGICILFYAVRRYFVGCFHQVIRLEKVSNSPVVTGFTTMIGGLTTIRAYRQQQHFLIKQAAVLDNNKKAMLNKLGLEHWFELVTAYLIFILNATCVGYAIFSSGGSSAGFGLLLISMVLTNEEVYQLYKEYNTLEGNMICLERLYEFMTLPVEPAYVEYCAKWDQEEQELQPAITRGAVEFREAYVRYREDLPDIIKGLSVVIAPGEKVGVVGRTGSGKSTIINALLCITQLSRGNIFIDGVDFREIPLKNLRSGITVIDQEPVLIDATFRENLDIMGRHRDEELINVLIECNLWGLVQKRGGLQGKVDQNGLSAGEKQLLCICRAFLKETRIVLIDEATANIDGRNDQLIHNTISKKFREMTVITIAHRLTTLHNYDKILVMEGGKMVEFGPPDVLSKYGGIYHQMVTSYAAAMQNPQQSPTFLYEI